MIDNNKANGEKPIKVLHLVGGNLENGAARGVVSLHLGLIQVGVESQIITNALRPVLSVINARSVYSQSERCKRLDVILSMAKDKYLPKHYGNEGPFSTGFFGIDITKEKEYRDADIVHLHWINSGLMRMGTLEKICKPIVWTVRDMWPMTGGCHITSGCTRYKYRCHDCPHLEVSRCIDLAQCVFKYKRRVFSKLNIHVVGISNWISQCAIESALLGQFDISTIYNCIDCEVFFPIDKQAAREALGFRSDARILLIGAQNMSESNKGFGCFVESLRFIDKEDYKVVVFGRISEEDRSLLKDVDAVFMDRVNDNALLRIVYSAATVFVAPLIYEPFGKTIVESMACGTPVVCFDLAGPGEIVDHKVDGYKAVPYSSSDLASGITWLSEANNYEELCEAAIMKARRKFDKVAAALEYNRIYKRIIDEENN